MLRTEIVTIHAENDIPGKKIVENLSVCRGPDFNRVTFFV